MNEAVTHALAAAAILALNVPFGYWRAGLRKLSPLWFVSIHAPIPLAVALRFALGVPFRLVTLPLFVAAFFAGQWLGGWWRGRAYRQTERTSPGRRTRIPRTGSRP